MAKTNPVCALLVGISLLAEPSCGDDPSLLPSQPTFSKKSTISSSTSSAIQPTVLHAVQSSPRASCLLHQHAGADSSKGLDLFADDEGVVRFYSNVPAATLTAAGKAILLLDCKDEDGETILPSQTIDPSAASALADAYSNKRSAAPLQPPLSGDPLAPSQAELVAHGHPLRPDPSEAPVQYAQWLRIVSTPKQRVQSKPVLRRGLINPSTRTSQNWSGGISQTPLSGAKYVWVSAYWRVPTVQSPRRPHVNHWDPTSFFGVTWVGIDGSDGSSDVVQTGTHQAVYDLYDADDVLGNYIGSNWAYYAWVEWFPDFQASISLPVNPHDDIYGQAWIGDSSGTPTPTGGYAWTFMYNLTTNQYYQGYVSKPGNANFSGNVAEWIMERPSYCVWLFPTGYSCSKLPLAAYDQTRMDYPWAYATDGSYYSFGNSATDQLFEMENSNHVLLSRATTATVFSQGSMRTAIDYEWQDWF